MLSSERLEIIATLNHHLLSKERLSQLASDGATIFRVNGSHVPPRDLARYASSVREAVGNQVRLLVDLPGNKVRTTLLPEPLVLVQGGDLLLEGHQVNYPLFFDHLKAGDQLYANDSLYRFTVKEVRKGGALLTSHSNGALTSNKGIHLPGRELPLPFLFDRDRELLKEAVANNYDHVGFSFVRTPADVEEATASLRGTRLTPIIKVETSQALANLPEILARADMFLVDRGDLAADTGIERIHTLQNRVLREGKARGKKVFFATQFFHYMVENPVPLVAEVCGFSDSISRGVDGIQLSEEVAIGKHPEKIFEVIRKVNEEVRPRRGGILGKSKTAPILWMTGLSGAGKTTIATALRSKLEGQNLSCCLIDGDEFRAFWGNQAGYSPEERMQNQKAILFTAHQAAQAFDCVIVSSLSPFQSIRDLAREKLSNFHEIYVKADLEACKKRDPKGNYARVASGEIKQYVGVSSDYEAPTRPDLVINTTDSPVERSVSELSRYLLG